MNHLTLYYIVYYISDITIPINKYIGVYSRRFPFIAEEHAYFDTPYALQLNYVTIKIHLSWKVYYKYTIYLCNQNHTYENGFK